ncbi:MAG: glycosyltransferase [Planctomycetes bacterium]|nr:glycosyltransferase [Planctomycetota bacterium]
MQHSGDGIQSVVDAAGGRWRFAAEARPLFESPDGARLAALLAADERAAPLVALKRSARREVYAVDLPGLPPLLLKRYPARRGTLGRARDALGVRACAEFAMAHLFEQRGLPTPRALATREPPPGAIGAPSWFVGVRLLGVQTLGQWLERRFVPGDGAPTKRALIRRALARLSALHEAGLWHRDFHSGNLLLHDGAGPAAELYCIDLHGVLEMGAVPTALRARDIGDLLHSLRYVCSPQELEALAEPHDDVAPPAERVRRALAQRRAAHASSRAGRAFVASSRFAQSTLAGGATASHDRQLDAAALERLLSDHAAALAAEDARVLRRGRRSALTRVVAGERALVVKEFRGRGAWRRARAAFGNGVAAQARDLPVAAPLAAVRLDDARAFAVAAALDETLPLHLAAHEAQPPAGRALPATERRRVDAVATALRALLVALVERRFVHSDLSLKNLLLDERADAPRLHLVDLDAARPGATWSERRLARALAQLGDVPRSLFSTPQRVRFVAALLDDLGRDRATLRPWLRASARLLLARQHRDAATRALDLVALPTLHLFGNWKWTGPAEPAVALASFFRPPALLLLGPPPQRGEEAPIAAKAAARGVPHAIVAELRKHWNPLRTPHVAAALAPRLAAARPATIALHLDADQAAIERARALLPERPALLRCVHEAGPYPWSTRRLLKGAQLLVTPTRGLAHALETALARPRYDVAVLETSVERSRFRYDDAARARGRARLGLPDDAVVFGIVARIQRHRRFELLLEAWRQLHAEGNAPQLVLLGRGTHEEELAREPIARLGLQSVARMPGYQEGAAYVEALAACDAGLFLVPGTDVSCRAVREWMAMARPVVAMRRAPLPELIDHERDGWLVDEDATALARQVRAVADRARLAAAGQLAAATAERRFDPSRVAEHARALVRMAALALPGVAERAAVAARVVAAVRPGRLEAALARARRDGFNADELLAFDPAKSRDAVLDLATLARRTRPRLLIVEPFREWDRGVAELLRRLAPETLVLLEPGRAPQAAGALAGFPLVEA